MFLQVSAGNSSSGSESSEAVVVGGSVRMLASTGSETSHIPEPKQWLLRGPWILMAPAFVNGAERLQTGQVALPVLRRLTHLPSVPGLRQLSALAYKPAPPSSQDVDCIINLI